MEWQPIETAPKDGTEFLAYDRLTGKLDVCVMRRFASGNWYCEAVQFDGEWGALDDEFGSDERGISHWMPLPTPPASSPAPSQEPTKAEPEA